jgi:DNA-nicking Smr family endonuclease
MNREHDDDQWSEEDVVEIPIDGILDLHTFRPKEVKQLVLDYIECCLEEEIYEIRIIHGKGKGVLKELVQTTLARHPSVLKFGTPTDASSWGATVATLKPLKS